jgi:hypothetical protein
MGAVEMKKVFTFWEPRANLPGYIKLCLETWKGCLPNYEVVVLDYSNLGEYLTPEEQDAVLWREMTFAMQSDCIRCAVLRKHGGMWLDADTILTQPLDARFSQADVTMIARRVESGLVNYGAFISTQEPHAAFLEAWHQELVKRVAAAKKCRGKLWYKIFHHHANRLMYRWDYCVNAIIDPLASAADSKDYTWLDKNEMFAIPEEDLMEQDDALNPVSAYEKYWFEPGDTKDVMEKCAGIIMLHNSFTPEKYRQMTEEEFLAQDTRMAKLLKQLLKRG